jgi:hypothetical protein
MRPLISPTDLILPAALWPPGSTKLLTETSNRNLPGGKGRSAGRRVRLTTSPRWPRFTSRKIPGN